MLSRRERDRSLGRRRLVRAAAGDDYTVRLFNPYVSSIVGEKLGQSYRRVLASFDPQSGSIAGVLS